MGAIEPAYRRLASMRKAEEQALLERIRDWLERYLEIEFILEVDGADFEWPAEFPRRVSALNTMVSRGSRLPEKEVDRRLRRWEWGGE